MNKFTTLPPRLPDDRHLVATVRACLLARGTPRMHVGTAPQPVENSQRVAQ
ncbi:MAG: hypothetical protein JO142_12550 [Burkholderiales bacterium]|nr:hypothetical protein [Burkholderiales bacterium]